MMDYLAWTIIISVISYVLYKAQKKTYYFKKWGIPQPREWPFLGVFGANDYAKGHISILLQGLYNLNKEAKYIGCHMFLAKSVVLRDPELIKSVLVKNFDHFANRKVFVDEASDPLFGKNLAFINGERWREVRNLLSPAFTSSKMRAMFLLMSQCAENFTCQLTKLYSEKDDVETKDIFTRYANDVIATCAFGIEVDSLKNPNNEFYVTGRRSTNFQSIPKIKAMFMTIFPNLSMKLGFRFITKADTDYFIGLIKETIETRAEKKIVRPDMLQLMMEARNFETYDDLLEITAQAYIFFLGGFETTSAHMCLMCHELAVNQDVQRKLQAEVDALIKACNGKPTYEAVNDMHYLDAIFSETLRKYPPSFVNRVCSKDFVFPPAVPGAKEYTVKEGDEILIPTSGIHYDPDIYVEPEKFDPERFADKKITTTDVTLLGFGLGPRVCIGNRFAILETKVMFLHLLSKFNVVLSKRTPATFEYDKYNFSPAPKDGFWINLHPRK